MIIDLPSADFTPTPEQESLGVPAERAARCQYRRGCRPRRRGWPVRSRLAGRYARRLDQLGSGVNDFGGGQ